MVTGSDDNTATWRAARSCRGSRRESCTKFCGLTQQGASAESVKQSILTVNDAGVDFTFQDAGRGGVGMSLLSGAWNVGSQGGECMGFCVCVRIGSQLAFGVFVVFEYSKEVGSGFVVLE